MAVEASSGYAAERADHPQVPDPDEVQGQDG